MRWFWPAFTLGIAGNSVRLRQRIQAIDVLGSSDEPVSADHRFVTRAGVTVDDAVARAASHYARRHGLAAVDLVPADLPTESLLDLVRLVDPAKFRQDALAPGRGALHAVLVADGLAERAGIETFTDLSPVQLAQVTAKVKRYAAQRTDLAIAPGLHAVPDDPAAHLAYLQTVFSFGTPFVVATMAAELALLWRGISGRSRGGRWGRAAVAAYLAQPLVAAVATGARPRDLPRRAPLRLAASTVDMARTVRASRHVAQLAAADAAADLERQRKQYEELLADGTEQYLEPRRPDCPVCGGLELTVRVRTPDLLQRKPGEFTLEECVGCGHIFQNPRLTPAGLDLYYRDFYDGVDGGKIEMVFDTGRASYRGRLEIVEGVAEPRRWLDIGAGQGHFCLVGKTTRPETTFDGLDMGDSIEEAERRGWIDHGYRGMLPDLAPRLAGQYDLVSMHHYLEHTREPGEELAAAATVLEPGGLLLIELPDPDSRYGRLLGRWWGPWFQPQHQHFFSVSRLESLLAEHRFSIVVRQRRRPHQPCDLVFAVYLALNRIAPPSDVPWLPPSTRWARIRRGAAFLLGAPFLIVAAALDQILAPVVRWGGASNTYRVLARLDRKAS